MNLEKLGTVKTDKSHKSVIVYWYPNDRTVYIEWAGRTNIGKASSASHAMNMAEAWLRDK